MTTYPDMISGPWQLDHYLLALSRKRLEFARKQRKVQEC